MEDLHFTCEDFILYDFMDEYFETKNCSANPAFQEMTDTLVLATLQSFDTDLENFTLDGLFQLERKPEMALCTIHQCIQSRPFLFCSCVLLQKAAPKTV